MTSYETYRRDEDRKIASSLNPEYIEKFIKEKARDGGDWAVAYALLQVGRAINCLGGQIGGVDSYTGIQGIIAEMEILRQFVEKNFGEAGEGGRDSEAGGKAVGA